MIDINELECDILEQNFQTVYIPKDAVIQLIARLREDEKDAERYRWLRDKANDRQLDIITNHYAKSWNIMVDNAMKDNKDE